MFVSKKRPVVTSQWEHQKLAGTLALLWGNADFDRPPVPFESFVTGIALHDRAYGALDNLPIGELSEEAWMELTRAGFEMTWSDPVADIIARLHLKRLMSYGDSPARQEQAADMTAMIRSQIDRYGLDLATFERIDRITNLCDRIAFDFCFEAPAEGEIHMYPRNEHDDTVAVHYQIADGVIQVDPWPFDVSHHAGYLVGYQNSGYPTVLEPVILTYQLVPKSR